jgi:hypothetical protein
MNASRLAAVFLGCGLLLFGGCLFPSFDGFEDGEGSDRSKGDGADGSNSSGSNSSGTTTSSSSGNTTTSGEPARVVHCHEGDGGLCPIPSQYCCFTVGGPVCQDSVGISHPPNCEIQGLGFGKAFLCDGKEDCPGGEVCCFVDQKDSEGVNARCKPEGSCTPPGKAVCNGPGHECPTGSSCAPSADLRRFCERT